MQKEQTLRPTYQRLRLILGDQLHSGHSWYDQCDDDALYVLMEMRQETDYAKHHIQKVLGFFAAMRAFAEELRARGHDVLYYSLDDPDNTQSLTANLTQIAERFQCRELAYQQPDEYRLSQQLSDYCQGLSIATQRYSTEHFLTEPAAFQQLFKGKKTYLMETFYRKVRKQFGYLMEGKEPIGGKWNYDAENRNKLPAKHVPVSPLVMQHDLSHLAAMLESAGVETIGSVDPRRFIWPINREESLQQLDFFLRECLPHFGQYQDAMTDQYWSVYHSRISFSLNTKMLSPHEVTERAIAHWETHRETISLAQIEGFVRQIIGWREYMRCIYWLHMPDYAQLNFLGHDRKLPDFFWSGKTDMHCLSHSIRQSLGYAYAHHIQRLMVTGNFALLAQIDPNQVDQWYLGIYIDAIEWVEITNTRGMSQFADGGIVGTKPYISSGNYISKMGNYCSGCRYDVKKRTGKGACPFNSLYWNFIEAHRDKLGNNFRMSNMYRVWDRMDPKAKEETLQQAEYYLQHLEEL